jgi:hypothetical protein
MLSLPSDFDLALSSLPYSVDKRFYHNIKGVVYHFRQTFSQFLIAWVNADNVQMCARSIETP